MGGLLRRVIGDLRRATGNDRLGFAAMDFYFGTCSGNSARSAFALHESGAPFEAKRLDLPAGDGRIEAYRAINPMGKIPALIDGDVRLWESNAINWYVAETNPGAGLLPRTPGGRASVQRWLFFQAAHVSPACFLIFRHTSQRMQAFWKMKGDEASAAAGRKELARYLPVLEEGLTGRQWLEGDFSLADVAYASHLWLLADGGFDFSATPAVEAWLGRLLARPAWVKTRQLVYGD
jgi:glutathione S-transferase